MDIDLSAIVGDKQNVLAQMADALSFTRNVSLEDCKLIGVNVIKDRATGYLARMIEPVVQAAYNELTVTDGVPEPTWIFARRENWADAMDSKLEAIIEPYAHMLTSDWTARWVIGSKLHVPGGADEWIKEFAGEIYRNITYLHRHGEEGAPKTAAQILASVGIVQDDLDAFMQARPVASVQQVEERKTMDFNATISKLHMWNQMTGAQAPEVMALLDNATDSDDGLALSGVGPLGGDMTDVATLRQARATVGLQAVAAYILNGPPPAAPAQPVAPPPPPVVQGEVDLSQFMGGLTPSPVDVYAASAKQMMQSAPPVQPAAAAVNTQPAAPVPPKRTRSKGGEAPAGAVPSLVFQTIKEHTGIKSEDIGAAIGVSRGTFDNYAKGKAYYVPTTEHLHYLNNMLEEKIRLLTEAYNLLPKVQQ